MNKVKVALAGNPNVGKSTIFNALTGLKQHTGNWSGKTVDLCSGSFETDKSIVEIYDLPGTYSVISNSPEEKIARDYICFADTALTVVVIDASAPARSLNLALQICELCPNVLICVNLIDEAASKGITFNLKKLSVILNAPVIGMCAKSKSDIKKLKRLISYYSLNKHIENTMYAFNYPEALLSAASEISGCFTAFDLSPEIKRLISVKLLDNEDLGYAFALKYSDNITAASALGKSGEIKAALKKQGFPAVAIRDMLAETIVKEAIKISDKCVVKKTLSSKKLTLDKLLTLKITGIPITILFFGIILWLTIIGANYPSEVLSRLFSEIKVWLNGIATEANVHYFIRGILIDGIFGTTAWVISVMLPPMLVFFPLFTILEELGFLPRLAFNLDRCFACANSSGKQALTMCMGIGCNAVGVTGCRIISSENERLASIITNTFMPCNGRFGLLILLSSMYLGGSSSWASAGFVMLLIFIGAITTLLITKLLTSTVLSNSNSEFILELPPFRHPKILKTILYSFKEKTLNILLRAIAVSAPAGAIIWLLANINIHGLPILSHLSDFLEPLGQLMGMDGTIILAFILALPANEILLPIILMCYLSTGTMVAGTDIPQLFEIFAANDWTTLTAVNVMLFSVLHFPCATTLKTIYSETKSIKWTFLSFAIPTITGVAVCILSVIISAVFA